MVLRPDSFTEQAQEVLRQSQELVRRYRHTQWDAEHILMALLGQDEGVPADLLTGAERAARGHACTAAQPAGAVSQAGQPDQPDFHDSQGRGNPIQGKGRGRPARRPVCQRRAPAHRSHPGAAGPRGRRAERVRTRHRKGVPGAPQGARQPQGHRPEGRKQIPRPRTIQHRPHPARLPGQAGPGDRARFRDFEGHADPHPPHQEQSRIDRRRGRGQDGHRRRSRPVHRLRQRPRGPPGTPSACPRHGRDSGRGQVQGRVRRATQGRHG